jgi:hypothetical protein
MVLADLSEHASGNPNVVVEPLSAENAEGYAVLRSEGFPETRDERLAAAHRYLQNPDRQALIYVARLGEVAAGYVIMRIEPGGIAYFRDAFTRADMRRHGVYLSLTAHRLKVAREAGCTHAVVQANRQTSSSILQKRGFRPLCRMTGYAKEDTTSSGW